MERPDDAPPPPYSETDVYSASTSSALHPSPADHNVDDASVTASSSHSNIIYTPPETPDAQDGWAAAGGTDASPLPASAQAYFAARPAAGRPPSAHIVHAIHFAEGMTPTDLPYPGWAADRQIAERDWHDFVDRLLLPRADTANACIADRKLRADQEGTPSNTGPDATRRRWSFETALQTVDAWNEGFFAPRGVTVRLDPVPDFPDMPRAWDESAHDASREAPNQFDRSGPSGWPSEAWNRGRGRGWPRGRGMRGGPFWGAIRGGRGVQGEFGPHDHQRAEHGHRGHGRGHDTGGPHAEGHAHRSPSRSSVSSDSSSSSSGSDSSVGSLPDGDELSDAQVPIVRHAVWSWVHSGQPVSKAEYKRVKAEIKAAEGTSGARQAGNAGQRKEIKQLLAQWKDVQKSQKTAKKAARKEKKKEKKTRKWERKAERKASKKNKKDQRHSGREARRDFPTAGPHAHGAFGPPPPGAAPQGQPGAAFGPGAFGFFGGGRGGWGRGFFGGPRPHPPGAWPPGAASSEQAARGDAAGIAAAAVNQAHAARDQALRDAAAGRQAALETADRARRDAMATTAAAVRHAHAVRDAALHDVRRRRAEATAQAHATRDAALRDATASRQGAQAAVDRAQDEARRHQAAWQPWGWGAGTATSARPSPQAPYSPHDRDRTGSGKDRPRADSDRQTQYAQQEKGEASGAQAGRGDAPGPATPAQQDRAAEIRELENRLLALRMEADEALARQLAEDEARGGRPS